jgi:pyruvate dehydrogenase E1 component alpha subunit
MGVLKENEAGRIEETCLKEVEEALKFAEESPYPGPEEVLEDIYVRYP